MEEMKKDIFVAIRSVGERTEEACLQIVQAQLNSESQMVLIKNKPFPEANIESILYALNSKAYWALFLDADVLLEKDAIRMMVREAEKITFPFYQYNFRILDRGFYGESYGVHFYSTNFFEKALQSKDVSLQAQRPEYQLCFEMAKKHRIPSLSAERVVGLHGYQQFYTDLYRTTFVRAVKYKNHHSYMLHLYLDRYFKENFEEKDIQFMFWGLIDGMIYSHDNNKVPLDRSFFKGKVDRIFSLLDISEKGPCSITPDYVEGILDNYSPDDFYNKNRHWICPSNFISIPVPDKSQGNRFKKPIWTLLRRIKRSITTLFYD